MDTGCVVSRVTNLALTGRSRAVFFPWFSCVVLLEEDRAAAVDPVRQASGWRYITLQIADIDAVHDDLRSKGVREGLAQITLGNVARISMILDPDGNWIELHAGLRSLAVLSMRRRANAPSRAYGIWAASRRTGESGVEAFMMLGALA
jgi:hypothetical protein